MKRVIRKLHSQVGFFMVGILFVYASSGIILSFEHLNFMRSPHEVQAQLPAKLTLAELVNQTVDKYDLKDFEINEMNADQIVFNKENTYDVNSGKLTIIKYGYPIWFEPVRDFHKAHGGIVGMLIGGITGFLLLFLIYSGIKMSNKGSKMHKNNMQYLTIGILVAAGLVIVL